jgi:hypothetical protein
MKKIKRFKIIILVMFREYGDEMVRIFTIGDENGDV